MDGLMLIWLDSISSSLREKRRGSRKPALNPKKHASRDQVGEIKGLLKVKNWKKVKISRQGRRGRVIQQGIRGESRCSEGRWGVATGKNFGWDSAV